VAPRRSAPPPHEVADLGLITAGEARIAWADGQMPVLRAVRERLAVQRPLADIAVAMCLHVTAETANLVRALQAGGARVSLCAANPFSTQDDVAAALVVAHGASVYARRGEPREDYVAHLARALDPPPQIVLDDGGDLIAEAHGGDVAGQLLGATEETTTGLVRMRAMEAAQALRCPVLAINEAPIERAFNDRYGTGQSALDGILRATNLLLAGRTLVVLGYGWTGKGVALRAKGAGASVIVCEVDPLRALEARMEGYEVMPALRAAAAGDVFVTVTGGRDVLRREHFEQMKDGAVLANAGHFDVEIGIEDLRAVAEGVREVRPLVEQYSLSDGRRLNLLARGRVVNLAAAEGHPASVMDISFAGHALAAEQLALHGGELGPGVHALPPEVDSEVARLKLESLGVEIDSLSDAQREYLRSWETLG
jgi:adenosylhomocysteinase